MAPLADLPFHCSAELKSRLKRGFQRRAGALAPRALGLLLAGAASSAHAANIYKYTDERGRTVFNSSIPPEFVKNGYSILNERGQVIEVVPRALTPEEIAARDAAEQARLAAEEAQRKQEEADSLLLRTYRSPDEVLQQRDVRVARLDARLIELTGELAKVDAEVTRLTQLVALAREEGREPDAATVMALDTNSAQRQSLQNEITVVEAEKQNEIALAERNARRLQELLGAAEQAAAE